MGIALLLSKQYSHLNLVKLYVFGGLAFSLAYNFLFYNWYFYLVFTMGTAILFALAYWEVARKQEGKNFHFLLLAASAVLLIPLLPIPFVAKTILPFSFVNAAIVVTLPFAFKSRNPFLIIWGVISAYAFLILDILELLAPSLHEFRLLVTTFSSWTRLVADIGIITVVLWHPVTTWLYRRLQGMPSLNKSRLSLVPGGGQAIASTTEVHDIRKFTPAQVDDEPENTDLESKTKELESIFKNTARIFTLKHKPFLTREEAMDYLGMDEQELEDFLARYNIRKLYLSGKSNAWVVRRSEIDSVS